SPATQTPIGLTTRRHVGASPDTSYYSTDRPSSGGPNFKDPSPSPVQRPSGRPWPTGCDMCIFIRGILAEMGIPQGATAWVEDNRGALQAAAITGFNGRTKHVDIKLKCTRE
ncbi:unnamed protein product, partial [Discosporangium mesarthrocarpum]